MTKTITIYLFRDAVMIVEWTYGKFAKTLNTILFPENMKEDVKESINDYIHKHYVNISIDRMVLNDSGENISINSWSGFT